MGEKKADVRQESEEKCALVQDEWQKNGYSVWVVEGDGVNDILVSFECEKFFTRVRVPNFAGAIVRT